MQKRNLLPAIGAGFGLIAREPLSVLAWGAIMGVLTFGPLLLYLGALGPDYFKFMASVFTNPGSVPTPPPNMAAASALQPLQLLGSLLGASIIYSAIFRAILFPDQRRWAYLRLGATEFYVGVIFVVLYVIFFIAFVIAFVIAAIPLTIIAGSMIAGAGGSAAGSVALVIGVVLVLTLGLVILAGYFFGRLWMGAPMTVATGQLKLFDGWVFTRGYGLSLFGVCLLIILISLALGVLQLVVIASVAAASVGGIGPDGIASLFNDANLQNIIGPVFATYAIFGLVTMVVVGPIMIAPWARAYQLISADKDAASGEVFA